MEGRASSPRTPDGMLAMSARGGDMQAFGELYHRHARAIYDFLLRTLHDPSVAAELTQSTFRRAFGRFDQLRDADRVRPWLFTLAYQLAVTQMRRGPVPPMVEESPRTTVPVGPSQPGTVEQLDSVELVWTAASSIGPELYAVLDLTARQGVDLGDLTDDVRMTRAAALSLLERAHDAFGRAVRDLVVVHGEEWCPGLATLVQGGGGTLDAERSREVDEHLGRCPRCRPLAERMTSTSTLATLALFELPHELAREGWDQLMADLVRASPRATQGQVVESSPFGSPGAGDAQPAMSGYQHFHSSGASAGVPSEQVGMMRHESVRRYRAQAERASTRRTIGAVALAAIFFGGTVAIAVVLSKGKPAATTTTTLPATTASTARPAPPSSHPTTTQHARTTTTVKRSTTTTKPSTTTTVPPVPPSLASISPTSGDPGTAIVVDGSGFQTGDFIAYTGPTYPGHTELITPTSQSANSMSSSVPTYGSFGGQQIVITVRNPTGVGEGSATFVVLTYYTGEWTSNGAKVSLAPTTRPHGSTKDGQINVFATDVEGDQCMVDDTIPVYAPLDGGPPIAVLKRVAGCPAADFALLTS